MPFIIILFSKISAREIIFVLCSIMALVCNMEFVKRNIDIIELMCYVSLDTHAVVLVKIGRILFSYCLYFLHY